MQFTPESRCLAHWRHTFIHGMMLRVSALQMQREAMNGARPEGREGELRDETTAFSLLECSLAAVHNPCDKVAAVCARRDHATLA